MPSVSPGARSTAAEMDGINVIGSHVCVDISGGNRTDVSIRDLRCEDFLTAGIRVVDKPGTTHGEPTLAFHGVRLMSRGPDAVGLDIEESPHAILRDVQVGPMSSQRATGVTTRGSSPTMDNVTFVDVGGWNVRAVNPGEGLPFAPVGQGDPGGKGHLLVIGRSPVRAVTGDPISPVQRFKLDLANDGNVLQTWDVTGSREVDFRVAEVLADGTVVTHAYDLHAVGEGRSGRLRAVAPVSGEMLVVRLVEQAEVTERFSMPLPAPLAILGMVCVALAWRRRA